MNWTAGTSAAYLQPLDLIYSNYIPLIPMYPFPISNLTTMSHSLCFKNKLPLIAALVFLFMNCSEAQYTVDFEDAPVGIEFDKSHWLQAGFKGIDYLNGVDRTYVDTLHAAFGKKSLRVYYPKGGLGPGETGHQVPCDLADQPEYYLSYWMYFSEDFSWGSKQKGGKLPGLATGLRCSGGYDCNGHNGFSARFTWENGGRGMVYLYHMDKPGKWGDSYPLSYKNGLPVMFRRGEWLNIIQRVKINSGNNHDGEVQVWYNGEEVLFLRNIRFVNNGEGVNSLYFSTFHGGGTHDWSPQNDCYAWFDQIQISAEPITYIPAEKSF